MRGAWWIGVAALAMMGAAPDDAGLPLDQAWKKARVDGKYRNLLGQFKAPEDRAECGEFKEIGAGPPKSLAGRKDLPAGAWVYVYPYWYVWRDVVTGPAAKLPHSPEQVTGPPDTPFAADVPTAWASLTPDGQDEWLVLEYDEPVVPAAVKIFESFSPGAVSKVSVFRLDGTEAVVWSGKDPTPNGRGMGVFVIPIKESEKVTRVKLTLSSMSVPGWNEIDAVGLVDSAGKTRWASAADASSAFGQPDRGSAAARAGGAASPMITIQNATQAAAPFPATVTINNAPPGISVRGLTPAASPSAVLEQKVLGLEADQRRSQREIEALRRRLADADQAIKDLKAQVEELKKSKKD
jgi:hypothetical protein